MTRHLLVIGGQRCGTTYLASLLDAHPEIAMARPARPEPKVFLSPDASDRGRAWYRSTYFAHAREERVLGEKSTSYIEHPAAAARAAAVLDSPFVVAQLRDPVARAVSNWRFSVAHGIEDRSLVQALTENLQGPRPWNPATTSVSPYAYLERGHYAELLAPWLERFPDTWHVCFLEELESSLPGVYGALGVDPAVRPEALGRPVNASEGDSPDLPASLVDELRDHFRESDDRLRDLLGRELPWTATVPTAHDTEAR